MAVDQGHDHDVVIAAAAAVAEGPDSEARRGVGVLTLLQAWLPLIPNNLPLLLTMTSPLPVLLMGHDRGLGHIVTINPTAVAE